MSAVSNLIPIAGLSVTAFTLFQAQSTDSWQGLALTAGGTLLTAISVIGRYVWKTHQGYIATLQKRAETLETKVSELESARAAREIEREKEKDSAIELTNEKWRSILDERDERHAERIQQERDDCQRDIERLHNDIQELRRLVTERAR